MKNINDSLPKILVYTKSNPELRDISITLEGTLRDFDKFIATTLSSEPLKLLDSVSITDGRINSMIREKDAEILKYKERLVALERARLTTTGGEHNERTILALKTENTQLKNELSQLRSKAGDANVYASYQTNIKGLNEKILQLEQEKSNLSTELRNLKNEYEVKLNFSKGEIEQLNIRLDRSGVHHYTATDSTPDKNRVDNDRFKGTGGIGASGTTGFGGSSVTSPNYVSPMNKMTSPEIKMVESTYKAGGETTSTRVTPGAIGSNLTSSGSRGDVQPSYGSGATGQRYGSTATTGATGATGGVSGVQGSYGTTGTSYGVSGTSGVSGQAGTYGTTGGSSTGYGTGSGSYGQAGQYSSSSGSAGQYGSGSGTYTAGSISGSGVGGGISSSYGTSGVSGTLGGATGLGATGLGATGLSGTSRYTTSTQGASGTGTSGTGTSGTGTSGTGATGTGYQSSSYRYNSGNQPPQ